jgi:hypothetical protein
MLFEAFFAAGEEISGELLSRLMQKRVVKLLPFLPNLMETGTAWPL